jgi:hypothetical protein
VVNALKRFLVGQPLPTSQAVQERLTERVALAVFSSGALSSVAYATEGTLPVLAVAAAYSHDNGPFFSVLPISLAIAVLLWLVRDQDGRAILRQDGPGLPRTVVVDYLAPANEGMLMPAYWGTKQEYEQEVASRK